MKRILSSARNRYHTFAMALSDTMRAVVTRGHGGLEQLDLTEVPVPRPAPGWVVVDVSACGLNNTDIWAREGRYGTDRDPDAVASATRRPGRFPIIQGAGRGWAHRRRRRGRCERATRRAGAVQLRAL